MGLGYVGLALLLLFPLLILLLFVNSIRKTNRAWKHIASVIRMDPDKAGSSSEKLLRGRSIRGVYRNREIAIREVEPVPEGFTGGRKRTRLTMNFSEPLARSVSFTLRKRTLFHGRGFLTGDQEFDKRYVINSVRPDAAEDIFSSASFRQRFLDLKGAVTCETTRLMYEEEGMLCDVDRALQLLNVMSQIADSVEAFGT